MAEHGAPGNAQTNGWIDERFGRECMSCLGFALSGPNLNLLGYLARVYALS